MGLASGIDAHHDYVRFTWTAGGTADAPLFAKGTVFARLAADGRFQSVIGFTDAAPPRCRSSGARGRPPHERGSNPADGRQRGSE
jgi:hypothetical protein